MTHGCEHSNHSASRLKGGRSRHSLLWSLMATAEDAGAAKFAVDANDGAQVLSGREGRAMQSMTRCSRPVGPSADLITVLLLS